MDVYVLTARENQDKNLCAMLPLNLKRIYVCIYTHTYINTKYLWNYQKTGEGITKSW